ncbi:ATP-binding protein [Streptomyces sp. NPDC085665]|uniref:ATP-binding protein n=1 Tax=Streptomyces sp. NPDC085665 TaxID=3365735 RepID=UPI0037CFCAB9
MEERRPTARVLPTGATGLAGAEAREAARTLLEDRDPCAAGVDNVVTVVSELVANASRHGGGAADFTITAHDGTVTVEVGDRSSCLPVLQPWAPDVPGGFGWRLVNELATTDIKIHSGGKTVTATLTPEQTGLSDRSPEPV